MKIDPSQGSVPANDKEPSIKNGGGDNIFGFADVLGGLVHSKPMFLSLIRKYGFTNKRPLFKHHKHMRDKSGVDIGYNEFSIGSKSLIVYLLFFIELFIKLVLAAFYLIAIAAILLVILRGLELPEYVRTQIFQQPNPPINVKVIE